MTRGFDVDTGQVDSAGRSVCDLADDLRRVRSGWDTATRDGGKACGMDVAERAYTSMQDAWFDEIGVHLTILDQACQALRDSANAYARSEDSTAHGLDGHAE